MKRFRLWWLLFLIPVFIGLWRVRLDTEILNLLPDSVAAVRGMQLYQRHFINSRELLVTVRARDPDSAETAARIVAETLRRKTNLVSSAIWQAPWLEHPEELAEFVAFLRLNDDPQRFSQFAKRLAPEQIAVTLDESRERLATSLSPAEIIQASYDPFGFTQLSGSGIGNGFASPQEGFASQDGTFRIVFVEGPYDLADYKVCDQWISDIRAVVQRAEQESDAVGIVIRYTGSPAFLAEIATSMARDVRFSLLTSLCLIIVLFWWAHRSWRPLCWLLAVLLLVVTGTLAAGGLIFGALNSVSLGFGAILLGLAVDHGLILYHEASAHPELSTTEIRRIVGPGIVWSALTTAAAFLLLNFAGLPGLSQLGTLVGIGMLLSFLAMLYVFLPLGLPRIKESSVKTASLDINRSTLHLHRYIGSTVIAAGLAAIIVWRAGIPIEHGNRFIEPGKNPAQIALNELRTEIAGGTEPLLVLYSAKDEKEMAHRIASVDERFAAALTNGADFTMRSPGLIWPNSDRQKTNMVLALELSDRAEMLKAAAREAGFTRMSVDLADKVMSVWRENAHGSSTFWPTNASSRWLINKFAKQTPTNWVALGVVYPGSGQTSSLATRLDPQIPEVTLTGWTLLGESLISHVGQRFAWLLITILLMVVASLRMAFGRWLEVLISMGSVLFALLMLQTVMSVAGLTWNLVSLAALPLLVGAGVDYSIHVQMALRRHEGDIAMMRKVTGQALLLCALTSVIGFGSNVTSSNPGLASLSSVCGIGLLTAYLTAVCLTPAWWRFLTNFSK